ncbi:MAG: hypothetical protein ACRD03_06470, partial [Acidimicrobiales bacterium]
MLLDRALVAMARRVVAAEGGTSRLDRVVEGVWGDLEGGGVDHESVEEALDVALRAGDGPLELFPDGRVADVAHLAEAMVLTHRLSEAEVATATLDLSPDLAVLGRLARLDGGLHDADGTPLRPRRVRARGEGRAGRTRRSDHLDGPPGWLAGFAPGSPVAASAAGGFLRLEPVDEDALQAPPPDVAERLGALLDLADEGDGTPVHDDELQLLATLDGLGWFDRPGPPFAELAEAAGMEVDGDLIGRPGCWEQYKAAVDMVATLARHDGDEPELSLLLDAVKAFDAWRADPDAVPPRPLAERLRARWLVSYWVLEELRRRGAGPDELAGFAAALGGPTGRWLT